MNTRPTSASAASRACRYSIVASMLVLNTSVANAQDALLMGGRSYSATRNFPQELGPAPLIRQEDIFGGGRFGILTVFAGWLPPTRQVFDGRSGQAVPVSGQILAVDRARPRVFVGRADGVWWVDVAGGGEARLWDGDGTSVRYCDHAYSANVLYCGVPRLGGLTDVVAIDVPSGRVTTGAAVPLATTTKWRVTADGRRLYFGEAGAGRLAVLDTSTGATIVSAAESGGNDRPYVVLDEVTDRVFVVGGSQGVTVLSRDLVPLGAIEAAGCANLAISPHTGRLYFGEYRDNRGIGDNVLGVFDAATFAPLAPMTSVFGYVKRAMCPYLVVRTAPGAPKDVTASVAGRDVTFRWTNVGAAGGFVLDAGVAPGRTDVTAYVGPDPTATFRNVPPGTYDVRVRGGNEFGGGRPSQELRIVVP